MHMGQLVNIYLMPEYVVNQWQCTSFPKSNLNIGIFFFQPRHNIP